MPTFRLEMSSDSDDNSIIILDSAAEFEPILIVLDESSDSEDPFDIVPAEESDSFVVPDESSDSEDLSFDGLDSDGNFLESSDTELSSDDEEGVFTESDSLKNSDESDESDEILEEISIWCSLCERFYSSLSFSVQCQKMHASSADPDRIFCLNHTSSSGFGDFYAFDPDSKGDAPKHVDMINHYGQNCGYRNRNVFERHRWQL